MLKKSRTFPLFIFFLTFSFIFSSCSENKHKVDTSDIEVNTEIERYEDWIFSIRDQNDYVQLYKKDTLFFKYYFNNIIGDITGGRLNSDIQLKTKGLVEFVTNKDMNDLYESVKAEFADLSEFEKELSQAFKYYKYHFPKKPIPQIVSFVSPFRSSVAVFENKIGIGLDMYLGEQFEPYYTPSLDYPSYFIRKLRSDYITPNVMKAWLYSEFSPIEGRSRFIDEIFYEGKILYALDALLPDTEDSLKIGYFENQLEWCDQNEYQIYDHINSNELWFTSSKREFTGLLQDGPFSKGNGIPQDSPPRIGVWLGWKIIRMYMDEHPEISLTELFNEADSEKILRESKYKP